MADDEVNQGGDYPPVVAQAIAQVKSLATLPEVARQVLRVTEDPDVNATDVVALVNSDPVLSSRVLKVVNSAFYGRSREVDSISKAVLILGLNAVRSITIAASLGKMFRTPRSSDGFDARGLWRHSTAVACAARQLARPAGLDSEFAFLLGTLHDIGLVVEAQVAPDELAGIARRLEEPDAPPLVELEREEFGASHQEFGDALCAEWRFPANIQEVVASHHQPERLEGESRRYALLLGVADALAHLSGAGYAGTHRVESIPRQHATELGLTEDDIARALEALPEAVRATSLIVG